MRKQLQSRLINGLKEYGLENQGEMLIDYLMLLIKWNKAYNLTAVRDPIEMINKHLLDSLSILPYIKGERVVDVGSGAGLPGIPVAVALPHYQVTLIDSNGKKARFLQAAKRELNINNIHVIHSRVEKVIDTEKFDCILSRAFSDLGQMLKYTKHLIKQEGIWLAMKGRITQEELAAIPYPFDIYKCNVPHSQHHCVVEINQS